MAINLLDITSNNNNLTNSGATEWTTDFPFVASTEAVALAKASSQYLYAADSASLSITGDLTLEGWFKFDSLPSASSGYMLWNKYLDTGSQRSYRAFIYNVAGTYYLYFYTSTDGVAANATNVAITTPSTGTWYHYAITYSASTHITKYYVDGSQVGTNQDQIDTSIYNSTATFIIGTGAGAEAGMYFDGKIDEVRVWNTVRTVTEISNNKSVELVGNESGLVAYWPFETIGAAGGPTVSYRSLLGVGI